MPRVIDMTELTAPSNTDMMYIVDDPTGTPAGKKISWSTLKAKISINEQQEIVVPVENLAPGADIATRPVYAPTKAVRIMAVHLLTQGTPAGVDDSNTVVVALKNDNGDTIVTTTYDTGAQPPTNGRDDLSASIDTAYQNIADDEFVTLSVTQGATANMPAFLVIIGVIVPCKDS